MAHHLAALKVMKRKVVKSNSAKPQSRLLDDPWLNPYRDEIEDRMAHALATAKRLAGRKKLGNWAAAHEYYGLHRTAAGWVFREWAPNATEMWLVGDFSGWKISARFALSRNDAGDWTGEFPSDAIAHGQFYRLEVRWNGGSGERIPAYARRVVQDPTTSLFAAQVWNPEVPYKWRNDAQAVKAAKSAVIPVIYEAHVGMAGEEGKVSSYSEFRDLMLPRIKAAGYNTVQLMAVMEHPYYGSFGYHVSSFFAASSRFGTPEDLKSLIDTAHGMGMRVIMDIVHSHAVKNERDGLSVFDGTEWQYFHAGSQGMHPAWDSRCFDYGKTQVLHFLLSNCRFWLDEYHFDGYRFDGVTSMLYRNHGLGDAFTDYSMYFGEAVDRDAWVYLALANRVIHETHPLAVTIAEDVSGMPGCAAPAADGGMGFDYRMAMGEPDYWFKLAEKVRDEDWSMQALYHMLTDKRAEEKTVSYVESHDQALVGGKTFFFQLVDSEIYYGMRKDQCNAVIDRGMAVHKMARLATFALNGGAYLNFMGNEFGHPEWIDFPREGNNFSFDHARRQWSLRDDDRLKFKALADWDAAMTALAKEKTLFAAQPIPLVRDDGDKVLAFMRGDYAFVFNFDPSRSYTDYGVLVPPGGEWRLMFDSDELRFGGFARVSSGQKYFPENSVRGDEIVQQIKLYLPSRTVLVLRRFC
jgi:1,4-alpha-glucan branching enzyme